MIYSRDEVLKATKSYFNDDVLAADVCVNKYLLKDKEGNLLEKSPDDMHKRMAKEFARIEQKYDNPLTEEEIYSTFKDFRYIVPQGSPMAGIGNNEHLTSLGNCFTENNFVLTNKGYKKISEVKIGDFVLSHKGLWKAVVNVMSRYYQGNIDVYTSSLLTNSIEVTPEHPFYNGNGIWVESKNNQKLMLLNFQHETNDYTFDLLNFVKQRHDQEIILDQSKISLKTKFIGRWGSNSQKNSHSINRFINLDENFAYVLGVFIGDGCVYSNHKDGEKLKGITITFSNKDQKNLLTIKQILENKFGCDFYINGDINKQNFNNVRKGNKILADFFSEICGRGFENKKIPDLIWHSSYEIKKSFLLGVLDSNGCVCRNGSIKLTITNKTLINNLQALAISLGYVFNNTLAKNKNYQDATNMYLSGYLSNELRQHSKKNYDDDRIEKKLEFNGLIPYIDESNDVETIRLIKNFKKEQKEFTGWVYNLSVEDDESYVVNNVICHNCNVVGNNSDSYGGILQLDQELAHLMKRRCVEEDSYVCTLEKGIIKLKDVEIGDYILSFNLQKKKSEFKKVLNKFKSEVNEEDRVKIIFSNGTELKTSKNHPILIKNENYEYKNVRDISLGEVGIKPELQDIKLNFDTSLSNIGWFIGSHIGDGTCGQIKQKTDKETNEHVSLKLRMRILNNNENVVKHYANILNELTESKSNYIKSKQKAYKVDVWEYSNNHSNINDVIEKYFDNQTGRKTYSAKIPSFIVQNNLWIPFIAGLIDTDGTINDSNEISLELCAKSIIDGVSSFLSSIGVSFKSFERIPKNTKHHKLYGIKIHCSEVNIINLIKSFMVNDDKIEKLELLNNNLINNQQYNEINQGIFITSILNDETSLNYIDLEVEETNNFYSGNFGLVNIHNCGVGLDLSHIRPKDSPVNNAAITATGVVPFMERYSNTTREVAQCLYGDTLVLTEHGLVKIKDIKQGTKVWTKNGFVTVIDVIKNNKSVSKLISKYGNEIICSLDHVIHTIEGEKKLKDLSEGDDVTAIIGEGWNGKDIILNVNDYVSSFTNHSNRLNTDITFPNILDEEFAYFLGNCYGNGYTDNACEIEITSSWDEVIEKNKIIVKKLFNYDAKIQDKKTYKKLKIHSKLIVKFLQDDFCLKEKSHSIKFPEFLLTAKKEIVFSFISGFFDADGCFEKGKKSFSMTSTSKNFLLLIQQIFYSWGIRSKIHTKVRKNENWKTLYLLSIDGSQNQKLFYSLMVESIKVNSFPLQEKRNDWTSSIYTTKDFNTNAGKHDYISSSKQHLSYSVCVKLKEELGLDNKITLFKDYVETIEGMFDDELVEVYDLVLEKEHLFFGNCFYVHNSGRRGALLLSIDVKHPDAEDFIDAKLELKKVTGANISVKLSDEFLDAIVNKKPFIQKFPIDSDNPIISREIDPLPIWKKLVHNAWKSGEPGIFLWSKVISESPADCYSDEGFKTVTTNPCGEIPLAVGDACRLLLLNLYSFVEEPFTKRATFNFSLFEKHVEIAQRLMDDIVDLEEEKILKIIEKIKNHDPEELKIKLIELSLWNEIHHKLKSGRRTGLGITAEADMLAALGLRYATQEATEFSTLVHSKLAYYSLVSSVKMAEERGSFPIWNYEKEKDNPFLNRVLDLEEMPELRERYKTFGRRNISSLTIAPAGSVSLLTQTSSGVEPVISLYYVRRRKINPNDKTSTTHFIDELGDHWEEYNVVHPKFQDWATINHHCSYLDHLNKEEMIELIKLSPYYNSTANEIDPLEKVRMIGAIQQFVDHSISSTGNLPETASEDVVESYFFEAWKSGCKGITVYRDKCRSGVLLHSSSNEENKINIFKENHAPKRGKSLPCDIIRFSNKGDKWIGFLGLLDNKPYEVFTGPQEFVYIPSYVTEGKIVKEKSETLSKNIYNLVWVDKDGFVQEFKGLSRAFNREYWNIGRLVSGILRHGMPLPNVISLIDSLEIDNSESITNWKNGVKRMLKKYISEGTKVKGEVCPECGSHQFIYKEGCLSCQDCGWSKCG